MRLTVALALGSLLVGVSLADNARAEIKLPTNIPREDLGTALQALANSYGVQLVYFSAKVDTLQTAGAVGELSADEAFKRVLSGTGLTYRYLGDKTVTIVPIGSRDQAQVETGSSASAEGEWQRSFDNRLRLAQASAPSETTATDAASKESPPAESFVQIAEITVTAQRIVESIDKVPISMTALSQQDLDARHIDSLSDLASVVPGLVLPTTGSGAQALTNIIIRGVFSSGNAPTTSVYIDETPLDVRQIYAIGFSGTAQPDLFDLERIEVLRGPQGTLFGSGAMGGAIRYITTQPNLETSSGYGKAEMSFTDRGDPSYAAGFAYGAPIVAGVAGFRVSGYYHSDGGFVDLQDPYTGQTLKHSANSADGYVLRPAFTVVPADGFSITAAFFDQHQHSEQPPEYWLNNPYPTSAAYAGPFGAYVRQPYTEDLRIPSLTIKYQLRAALFQSDTSYLDQYQTSVDDYSNILPALFGLGPVNPQLTQFRSYDSNFARTKAWQQQFRLMSSTEGASRFNWVVGAYFRRSADTLTQYVAPDLTPLTELFNPPQTSLQAFNGIPDYVSDGVMYNSYGVENTVTEEKSLFGEVTLEVLPRLKVAAGVRFSQVELRDQSVTTAGPLVGTNITTSYPPNQKEHPVTPRFTATYQYTSDNMVYASAAKGFRAGGSNLPAITTNPMCNKSANELGFSSVPAYFDSDSLWSYEVGTKGAFFDHRLQAEASVYYIDWSNIQANLGLPSCGGGFTTNLGVATSQGFDLQLQALVVKDLKIGMNVGYDRAYYRKNLFGAPTSDGAAPPLVIAEGEKVGITPWTAAVIAEYSRSADWLWENANSYIRMDYRWRDRTPGQDPRTSGYDPLAAGYSDQAYSTLNIRVGLLRQGLDVSAFVNNITNAKPILGFKDSAYPMLEASAIRPLTAGVTLLYHF